MQNDFDGTFSYSKLIAVSCTGYNDDLIVYPNPAVSEVTIETRDSKTPCSLHIINSLGQIVFSATLSGKLTLPTNDFEKGVYLVKIENNSMSGSSGFKLKKFIKD